MAVAGDIASAATIRSSRAALAALGDDLLHDAGATGFDLVAPASSFPLLALGGNVVDPALARSSWISAWVDDLRCRQRGTVGASLLQEAATGTLVAPARDAIAAGVAVGTSPGIQRWGWTFHSATAFRQLGERGVRVHDPLLFDRPVSLTRWARAIGTRPSDVTIETPITAHRGHLEGDYAPTLLLDDTWDRVPAGYRFPGPLRLDPDGTESVLDQLRRSRSGG